MTINPLEQKMAIDSVEVHTVREFVDATSGIADCLKFVQFESFWNRRNKEDPGAWPTYMSGSEWRAEYANFVETEPPV